MSSQDSTERADKFFRHLWETKYGPAIHTLSQVPREGEKLREFDYAPQTATAKKRQFRVALRYLLAAGLTGFGISYDPALMYTWLDLALLLVLWICSTYVLGFGLTQWTLKKEVPTKSLKLTLTPEGVGTFDDYGVYVLSFSGLVEKFPQASLNELLAPFDRLVQRSEDLQPDTPAVTEPPIPHGILQMAALEEVYSSRTRDTVEKIRARREVEDA